MNRVQGLMITGAVLLVAGCAAHPQYQMVKKEVMPEERVQDDAHCQMQASYIQRADWEYRGTIMEGVNIQQKRKQTNSYCMSSKGYSSIRVQ